ncbi:hypothetical protein [Nocardia sp. NPDC127526]|uniref:hypothetical protein n=1 Tax=Nocardia sp. NPDC127526 TaxID=3345393 RepID=UPI0036313BBA
MGGSRLESYKDLLRTAKSKTTKVQDGIDTVVNTLVSAIESRGEPWGNDTLGKNFSEGENGYIASKGNIVQGARNMSGTFGNFAKGQQEALDYLSSMDSGNAGAYKQAKRVR